MKASEGRRASRRGATHAALPTAGRFDLVLLAPENSLSRAQLLASYAGATVVSPFETRGGAAGERMRRIVELNERILRALDGRAPVSSLPRGKDLVRYGTALFEALFPGDVRRLWDAAVARSPAEPVSLVFTSALDWVAGKPWELAYDPARRTFLSHGPAAIVRNVFSAVPAEPPRVRRGPLRILFAAARPEGTAPLAARKEEDALRAAFAPLLSRGAASLEVLPKATPETLHARLRSGTIDVFHFVGHGEYDEETRSGALLVEDGRGRARKMSAEAFARLASGRGLLFVFLNACETGRGGRQDFLRGVAPALAHAGLAAVAANQYRVFDDAAALFAAGLYGALADGIPVAAALREARSGLSGALGEDALDWAVPVLYARDPGTVLCRPSVKR
ncbi:MAG: CHAT domain-containing protein [Thermoanaerobaculia bacterium]